VKLNLTPFYPFILSGPHFIRFFMWRCSMAKAGSKVSRGRLNLTPFSYSFGFKHKARKLTALPGFARRAMRAGGPAIG
jgi:hypothetical protein